MFEIPRKILKQILEYLAKLAIRKHDIKFIVVVGWYGTELIREGTYEILSDRLKIRRNTRKIWWDLSIPLVILGYKDRQRNTLRWLAMIVKTFFSLITNKSNTHKIILDLNLADEDTAEYWSQIIKPELLIITNYKAEKNFTIEKLVKSTRLNNGKIIVSNLIKEDKFKEFPKFGYSLKDSQIITSKSTYSIDRAISAPLLGIYAAVIAVAEIFGSSKNEIANSLIKLESVSLFTRKVEENLQNNIH